MALQSRRTSLSFAAGRASSGSRPPPQTAPALLPCRRPEITYDLLQDLRFALLNKSRFPDCANAFPVMSLKIPCSIESNSLFRCTGNFAVTLGICDQIRAGCRDQASIFFPDNRELRAGDRFACDWLISQLSSDRYYISFCRSSGPVLARTGGVSRSRVPSETRSKRNASRARSCRESPGRVPPAATKADMSGQQRIARINDRSLGYYPFKKGAFCRVWRNRDGGRQEKQEIPLVRHRFL
jgi:hypothetical protein